MIALVRGLRGFKPISSVLESPAFHGPGEQTVLKKLLLTIAAGDTIAPGFSAISALWTFPSIIGSAMLIAWAAEAAQFLISQGLALAILAWLQPLPEFAVEAVIAWEAGKDPEKIHLVTANFTGLCGC